MSAEGLDAVHDPTYATRMEDATPTSHHSPGLFKLLGAKKTEGALHEHKTTKEYAGAGKLVGHQWVGVHGRVLCCFWAGTERVATESIKELPYGKLVKLDVTVKSAGLSSSAALARTFTSYRP